MRSVTNRVALVMMLALTCNGYATAEVTDSMSLDGTWEIVFDRDNEGRERHWQENAVFGGHPERRQIQVPSCWEEIEQDYEGVAFYRRKFMVPQSWAGRTIELDFGAVNYVAHVFLNDRSIGSHEGGFTPFSFRVDKFIRPGEQNTLTLRVVGPIILTDQEIDGMGWQETPQWRGAITGGIWQSVRLSSTGDIRVNDVFIEPKISTNTAVVRWDVDNTAEDTQTAHLEVGIRDSAGKLVASKREERSLLPGSNKGQWILKIPDARNWSLDDPHLYNLECTLETQGVVSDRWKTRFGMREFTMRDNRFCLNGKPIYLKACFLEGLYPVKLAYPDNSEMARREIQLAKDAGFNQIRPWRKPPPPMWLDLCDEMGMTVVGTTAVQCMGRPTTSPQLAFRVENELRQTVLRDRNRACVVMWELFNELSQRPIMGELKKAMPVVTRELDPTRLIIDESGGFVHGAKMFLPYEQKGIQYNDLHMYKGSQITEPVYGGLLIAGMKKGKKGSRTESIVPGGMTVISEIGYGSTPNLVENKKLFEKYGNPIVPPMRYHLRLAEDTDAALKLTGFDRLYDLEQYCLIQQELHGIANKRQLEAIRCNPISLGYCVHALTGGDWVLGAGILDLWRNPKTKAYEMTKEANANRIVSIRVLPRNLYAGDDARVNATAVNDLEAVTTKVAVEIESENGEIVLREELDRNLQSGISGILDTQLDTSSLKGSYKVKVSVWKNGGDLITVNSASFDVFQPDQLSLPKKRFSVIDLDGVFTRFFKYKGHECTMFDPKQDVSIPVIIAAPRNIDQAYRKQIEAAKAFVREGGFAVFVDVPFEKPTGKRQILPLHDAKIDDLPFKAQIISATGMWHGRPHMVKDHPVFDGLPVNTYMRGVYGNVHPKVSMGRQEGEYICGVVSYTEFETRPQYAGPGKVWWGATVLLAPLEKGQMLLSTLNITRNLGRDPVAEKILFNMIDFASSREEDN